MRGLGRFVRRILYSASLAAGLLAGVGTASSQNGPIDCAAINGGALDSDPFVAGGGTFSGISLNQGETVNFTVTVNLNAGQTSVLIQQLDGPGTPQFPVNSSFTASGTATGSVTAPATAANYSFDYLASSTSEFVFVGKQHHGNGHLHSRGQWYQCVTLGRLFAVGPGLPEHTRQSAVIERP
jgi:hypothetical protein